MLRRNPTRLDIRQDDIEQLHDLRAIYQRKLSQKPGASGKGKRKRPCVRPDLNGMIGLKNKGYQPALITIFLESNPTNPPIASITY
ncbi:12191_t:CDS:2 [Funneliformis mosseae]|uniref:12191_t:CDS:1 n=1 Tax=Funneliformis mosseae TaxID=27381 RepID=A0A9N9AA69_FUNMO|nr:12191_t:CDS:2 [Funneliformis mosseae]